MTGVRDDGDGDYDDSSLEFLYSRTLDKSAFFIRPFRIVLKFFLCFVVCEGLSTLNLIIGESWSF